jgi:hypothetical protein
MQSSSAFCGKQNRGATDRACVSAYASLAFGWLHSSMRYSLQTFHPLRFGNHHAAYSTSRVALGPALLQVLLFVGY